MQPRIGWYKLQKQPLISSRLKSINVKSYSTLSAMLYYLIFDDDLFIQQHSILPNIFRLRQCLCNFNFHKLQEAANEESCKQIIWSLGKAIVSKRHKKRKWHYPFPIPQENGWRWDEPGSGAWESTKSDPGCTYYPVSGMGTDQDYRYIGMNDIKETGLWQLHQSSSKEVKCDGNSEEGLSNRQRVCACSGSSPPPNTSYFFLAKPSSDLQGGPDNCNKACEGRGHICNEIMVSDCRSRPQNECLNLGLV